jgi:PucR family transcriptional regulator, purine catabolism regulatory protein
MITVKDVWRGALPGDTDLLGGGSGLERRVEWATALRTRPPAFEAIKGGEMAFVPVKSIRMLDERLDLAQVIQSFAEKGGVAVAVVGEASSESIAIAERMMVPLLRLPESAHLGDVQQGVVRFILEQRTLLHERQQDLHTQLMELALAGAGTGAIVDRLGEITGHAVAWQSAEGTVRHASAGASNGLAALLEEEAALVRRWAEGVVVAASDPPVHEFKLPTPGLARLVAPVPVRDGIGGYISVVAPDAELDQLTRLAVARAASACAIELDRERAVLQARDELEGEFLESLLAGTYSSETAVRHRAERLGFDLGGEVAVLVARPDGGPEAQLRARRDQLGVAAQGWIRRRAPTALATLRQGSVTAVLPLAAGADPPDLRRLAADLRLECTGAAGTEVSVGIGRNKPGIDGVRASYREAEQAVTMGTQLFGGGRTVAFSDLGLYRLLFAMQAQAELRDFYDDQVRPLVDYDRRTGAGLMATLDAFFRCHGSPTEIAAQLHLHRNTVLYRLRRIEDIGRLRLDDPETRLNLHLCLKVRDVLQANLS